MFKCVICKKFLGEESFHKDSSRAGGRSNKCIPCMRARDLIRSQARSARRAEARAALVPLAPKAVRVSEQNIRWSRNNPEKTAAHIALFAAVRRGRVVKQPCFVCGAKAEAHHPDYSRPLDVVWLCRTHHRAAHALAKQDPTQHQQPEHQPHVL